MIQSLKSSNEETQSETQTEGECLDFFKDKKCKTSENNLIT